MSGLSKTVYGRALLKKTMLKQWSASQEMNMQIFLRADLFQGIAKEELGSDKKLKDGVCSSMKRSCHEEKISR